MRSRSARSAVTRVPSLIADAVLVAADARQLLDEQRASRRSSRRRRGWRRRSCASPARRRAPAGRRALASRISCFWPCSASSAIFLIAGLELRGIAVEVERALADRVVLDALGPHQLVDDALAVLAEAELDQRVAPGPRRRCTRAGSGAPTRRAADRRSSRDADRRLPAAQRLPQHARRARRGPREGVAGRDDPGVARGGLETERRPSPRRSSPRGRPWPGSTRWSRPTTPPPRIESLHRPRLVALTRRAGSRPAAGRRDRRGTG